MKRWFVGCLIGMVAGIGAYLLVSQKQSSPVEKDLGPPTTAAPAEQMPAVPVVLAQVIEMADIDPLLDPPAKLPTGAPFDEETASAPITAPTKPAVPDRIPPAVEDASEVSEPSIFGVWFGFTPLNDAFQKPAFSGIEKGIREAVIREIERKTHIKVKPDLGDADSELVCSIVSIQENILNVTHQHALRESELVVTVEIVWRDLRDGSVLLVPRDLSKADSNSTLKDTKSETPESEPIRIVASGRYVPELGESNASAEPKIVMIVAAEIVSMMEKHLKSRSK